MLRRKPDVDVPAPTHRAAMCPTCVARVKVSLAIEKGKRVRCPKCKQAFDPFSASAVGSDRQAKSAGLITNDNPGLPEWQWAVIIGVGAGLAVGTLIGFMVGQIISSSPSAASLGLAGTVPFWLFLGSLGYAVYGTAIALAMLFTGGSKAGYIVALVGVLPVMAVLTLGLGRTGTVIGVAATLGFAAAIERIMDYKLYS